MSDSAPSSPSQRLDFTMDDNLLLSVMKAQAGTLSKALTEGVMNSADAGASEVRVSLTDTSFTIEDDGRGFASEEQIRQWFGRFGTPHKVGDAIFGRFRMGRGQLMAFAANEWRSGFFRMRVDLDRKGLTYELIREPEEHRGCRITGELYRTLPQWQLRSIEKELEQFVAFCPIPVYLNGRQIGHPAKAVPDWTFQDKDAYYRLVPDSQELLVYNQGIYVQTYGIWKTGMGGIVVSKRALTVNFARNDILQSECEVWQRIEKSLEQRVLRKLRSSKKLTEAERSFLARHLTALQSHPQWQEVKLLTDASGRHLPLSKLRSFSRFVLIEDNNPLALALQGMTGTFVVSQRLLERFGSHSIAGWLEDLRSIDASLVPEHYEVLAVEALKDLGVRGAQPLDMNKAPRKVLAAYQALTLINTLLASRLKERGLISGPRTLLLGRHRGDFQAWTDGVSTVTANVRHLKLFEQGLDGIAEWVQILLHEYTHDGDDSETHSHGEVFYRKFHDTVTQAARLGLGTLAHRGLTEYLRALRVLKAPRSRQLLAQARGRLEAPIARAKALESRRTPGSLESLQPSTCATGS